MTPILRPRPAPAWAIRAAALLVILLPAIAGAAAAHVRLLILTPASLNVDEKSAWLAPAIQRALVADLQRRLPRQIASSDAAASSSGRALELGRRERVTHLIFGTIQSVGDRFRFTGELLDVKTATPVAALKVTGRRDDLFELEDLLASQAARALETENLPPPKLLPGATIACSGPLRIDGAGAENQEGLVYCRAVEARPFPAERDRYFFQLPCYDCYFGYGWGYGCGFYYSWFPWTSAYSVP